MIHDNSGEILDCDFLTGLKFNEEFVQKFYDEIQTMRKSNGHIFGLSDSVQMPKFRHQMRHKIPAIDKTMDSDNELSGAVNITYRRLYSVKDIPSDLRGMVDFDGVKNECDSYHQKMMRLADHLSSDRDDEIVQNATDHSNR